MALQNADNFGLNWIWETMPDVAACVRYLHETRNESFKQNGFRKLLVSMARTVATTVSIVDKRNGLEKSRFEYICMQEWPSSSCAQTQKTFRDSYENGSFFNSGE